MSTTPYKPLAGVRVIDLSQGVAGPHCGMLMAQYGANVIKVEPLEGDWGRAIGRKFGDFSAYNIAFNRGKRSLAVNLKSEDGFAAVQTLMHEADVIVQNYRPGVMEKFGLDYDSVKARNPNVIYVSITGFGREGPRSKRPATDSILQSYSGLMSVNKDAAGMPQRIGVLVIDVVTGLYAYQAVATALFDRALRGNGRHISASLMDSIAAVQAGKMIEFHLEGAESKKPGVPVGTFKTKDGFVTINARRDTHYRALCELLGCPELIDDPRFATDTLRLDHEAELLPPIVERVATWHSDALLDALAERDILHSAVHDYADYFSDDHVQAVEAVRWVDHAVTGSIPMPEVPGLDSADAEDERAHSPAIGQHSQEILRSLGWSDSKISTASADGAVGLMR